MKLGLYSITYLGVWYRGGALTLEQVIDRAREYGYDGVEIDGKRPHGNPLDLSAARRLDLRRRAEAAGLEIYAVAANNDFSSPVPEHREAQLAYINALISLTADLGAPILRMFAAWPGVTFAPSVSSGAIDSASSASPAAKNSASSASSGAKDSVAFASSGARDSASSAAVGRYDVARRIWAAAHEGVSKEQTWAWCREGLIESARRAADQGVMLALQNHPPVVDNGDDMLRMVHEVGSPSLQACFDAPLARRQGVVDMRAALLDVGSRQVLSHFGGEYDRGADGQVRGYVREPDGSLTPESFYAEFARGLAEIGYDGYIGYELCHPLPVVEGRTVGIEFADMNARLAAEYMRAVLNDARTLAGHRAATGR